MHMQLHISWIWPSNWKMLRALQTRFSLKINAPNFSCTIQTGMGILVLNFDSSSTYSQHYLLLLIRTDANLMKHILTYDLIFRHSEFLVVPVTFGCPTLFVPMRTVTQEYFWNLAQLGTKFLWDVVSTEEHIESFKNVLIDSLYLETQFSMTIIRRILTYCCTDSE